MIEKVPVTVISTSWLQLGMGRTKVFTNSNPNSNIIFVSTCSNSNLLVFRTIFELSIFSNFEKLKHLNLQYIHQSIERLSGPSDSGAQIDHNK